MDVQFILDQLEQYATDPEKQAQAITTLATLAGLWVSKWVAWAGWKIVAKTTGFAWRRAAQPLAVKACWGTLSLIDRPQNEARPVPAQGPARVTYDELLPEPKCSRAEAVVKHTPHPTTSWTVAYRGDADNERAVR